MTTPELKRLTRKWQERLRLMDWDIRVRFATKEEARETWGCSYPENTTKTALIHIANPQRQKKIDDDTYTLDTEVTIVHELLHLHFAPFNHASSSHKEVIEEQIVSCVSQLLVALDRGDESILNPQNPRPLSKVARFNQSK